MRWAVLWSVLLLCTCLWITACGAPSEILTVEMYDNYMTQEPILLSVVMPPSYDVTELLFQINGMVYHTKNLPTEENPMFSLIAEDGSHDVSLIVRGFWDEAAMICLEMIDPDARYWSESLVCAQTAEFAPLQEWLEKAANKI